MKKTLLTSLLILFCISAHSQNWNLYYENGRLNFDKNSKAYLFANNVRLRQNPNKTSKELESLPILSKITLIEKTTIKEKINETESYWVKVKTKNHTGYILDFFISSSYTNNNGFSYVSRLNIENGENYLEFRKVFKEENGKYNAKKIKLTIPHNNLTIKTSDNRGLIGIDKLIFIKYISEACGIYGGGQYLFLKNGNIIDKLKLNEVSDAGIFWKTEVLIFPNENSNLEKNSVLFIQEIGNVIDEASQWYEKKIVERQYKFINGKFTPEFNSTAE